MNDKIICKLPNDDDILTIYQKGAKTTAPLNTTNVVACLNFCGLGLGAETGEVLNEIKGYLHQDKELNKEKVLQELGDVLFYLTCFTQVFDSSLEDIMTLNMSKRKERFKCHPSSLDGCYKENSGV